MTELVAYYDENPTDVKGKVEIHQSPMPAAAGSRSEEGLIRASLVYVRVPSEANRSSSRLGGTTIGRCVIETTRRSGS